VETEKAVNDAELLELLSAPAELTRERAQEIVNQGARVVPQLAAIVSSPELWEDPEGDWAIAHAAHMLAAIGGSSVVEPLIEGLRQAAKQEEGILLEDFPLFFGQVGAPAVAPLLKSMEEAEFVYLAAEMLASIAATHPSERDRILSALKSAAERSPRAEDTVYDVLAWFARPEDREWLQARAREDEDLSDAPDYGHLIAPEDPLWYFDEEGIEARHWYDLARHPERAEPEIRSIVDRFIRSPECADLDVAARSRLEASAFDALMASLDKTGCPPWQGEVKDRDLARRLERFFAREGKIDADEPEPTEEIFSDRRPADFRDEETELLQSSRTERNAPCPCGSGKKFKKCCGA
jgi:hypothetical protein